MNGRVSAATSPFDITWYTTSFGMFAITGVTVKPMSELAETSDNTTLPRDITSKWKLPSGSVECALNCAWSPAERELETCSRWMNLFDGEWAAFRSVDA